MFSQEQKEGWYFRSDDKPMESRGNLEIWTFFKNSSKIEENFQKYLENLEIFGKEKNPFSKFESDSTYFIDFRTNVRKEKQDLSIQKIIGRFEGNFNTLKYINPKEIKNLGSMKLLSDSDPKSIRYSLFFEGDQAFMIYNYIDIIFKLIDKVSSEKQAIDDLIQYSVNYIKTCEKDIKEKQTLELKDLFIELGNGKLKENAETWYSKDCFIYRMINTCLRSMNFIEVFQIRYYIYHLRKRLKELSKKDQKKKLFFGTIAPKEQIQRLKKIIGQAFQFIGLISTSGEIKTAIELMNKDKINENHYRVLFEIDAEEGETSNYSCIKKFSENFSEDEYLININVLFKIKKIEKIISEMDSKFYYYIRLKFSKESELCVENETKDFKNSLLLIIEKTYNLDSFFLAEILNQSQQAQATIDLLNNLDTSNENDKSIKLDLIGSAYKIKRDYSKAIDHFKKCLEIKFKILGKIHPSTATSFHNIGSAYWKIKEYEKAINYYEKCVEIRLKTLGSDNPIIATSYHNIGSAYSKMREYDKAIDYYQKSLSIKFKTLGNDHPSSGISYDNIGSAYKHKKEYDKAIEYYQKGLEIFLKTVGIYHQETATSYYNIATANWYKLDKDKAIENFKICLEIRIKLFGTEHPSTKKVIEDLKLIRPLDCIIY